MEKITGRRGPSDPRRSAGAVPFSGSRTREDQLRAAMDRFMQAMQEQLKNNQQLSRPLDRNSPMLRQQDLKNMLDRLESMARSGAKDAARELLRSSR